MRTHSVLRQRSLIAHQPFFCDAHFGTTQVSNAAAALAIRCSSPTADGAVIDSTKQAADPRSDGQSNIRNVLRSCTRLNISRRSRRLRGSDDQPSTWRASRESASLASRSGSSSKRKSQHDSHEAEPSGRRPGQSRQRKDGRIPAAATQWCKCAASPGCAPPSSSDNSVL
jgi:hypothetical protein